MKNRKTTFLSVIALTVLSLGLGSQVWGGGEIVEETQWECYVIHGNGITSDRIIVDYGMVFDPSICEYYHNQAPSEDIIVGIEVIEHHQNIQFNFKRHARDECVIETVLVETYTFY